jgi:autotransporter passenger strand-loop-strand repeat protein
VVADPTYQTKNYEKQGGATWVVGGTLEIDGTVTVDSGGRLEIDSGGTITVDSGGRLEIANGGTVTIDSGGSLAFGANAVPQSGATVAGQHTVTSGDVTATHASIATGLTTLAAMNVMIIRTGKIETVDASVSFTSPNIIVASGATYTLTAGDIIHWIAVGT